MNYDSTKLRLKTVNIKMRDLLILFVLIITGCGSSSSSSNETQVTETGSKPTLSDTTGYLEWLKFNKEPINGSTHGNSNIYINQSRSAVTSNGILVYPFPDTSIIVKEIISSGDIAIMRKVKGVDSEHGDWQFIEYKSNGTVIGKDSSCWGCHSLSSNKDFVFTNLQAE